MYHSVLPRMGEATQIGIVLRDASTGAVGGITAPSDAIPAQL
jgi:hypothetical protein